MKKILLNKSKARETASTSNPNTILTSVAFGIAFSLASYTHAAKPLSEEDMSDISLESNSLENILSISGATAAGGQVTAEAPATRDLSTSVSHAGNSSVKPGEDNTKVDGQQPIISLDEIVVEDFQTSKTINSIQTIDGAASSTFNPKLVVNEATLTEDGALKLYNKASVQRIQILNARDESNAIRGSYFYTDFNASTSAVITGR